jgi:hypothetical protein
MESSRPRPEVHTDDKGVIAGGNSLALLLEHNEIGHYQLLIHLSGTGITKGFRQAGMPQTRNAIGERKQEGQNMGAHTTILLSD